MIIVIKTIIQSRSPFMRHISRTHRVNLDWLFDRINLDPGILIKYVNTSKRIADKLTKGSFTRERWTQLTQLFNLMTPHTNSCSLPLVFSSGQKDDKMSKRLAERTCVYDPHSASSSSSSINPRQNMVRRGPEQDTNTVNSQNQVQKTQSSGKDSCCQAPRDRLR